MTAQDYLEQNLAGFENDSFAKEKFRQLIEDNKIEVFIETGTYLGSTTKLLSQWCNDVYSIEINENNFIKARVALKGTCVKLFLGSSETILNNIFSGGLKGKKIALLLDAHWMAYNPLLDELAAIANNGIKPVFIAVHDFKVPDHPEFGYDTYNGQPYEWDWIKGSIEKIYGVDGYKIEYNSEATGARRGIIYIQPK